MRAKCSRVVVSLLLIVGAMAISVPALAAYGVPTLSQTECPSASQFSIDLIVCGDAVTGAPAGVSIHWMKCADYELYGWDESKMCALSLSGMPGRDHGNANSRWDLGPGLCQTIRIGDNLFDETGASITGTGCTEPLECGTCYVFRIFAHADRNDKKSDFSGPFYCSTADCENGACTRTQGYWKNHGPGDCHSGQNANLWPANFMFCGLSQERICPMMNTNPGNCGTGKSSTGADAALKLFHQLIAAMLNVQVNGTSTACIGDAIARAQALLCPYPTICIGENTPLGQQMTALKTLLDDYNNGRLDCAKHCDGASAGAGRLDNTAPVKKASWGELKTTYR